MQKNLLLSRIAQDGGCHQSNLPELFAYRIVDAFHQGNVLLFLTALRGEYFVHVFRFDPRGKYDHRLVPCNGPAALNGVFLSTGVFVFLESSGQMELFLAKPKDTNNKKVCRSFCQ